VVVVPDPPRDRLAERPAAGALPVQAELRAETVEAAQDLALRVAELGPADDRSDSELALAGERLRVDREPGLPLGSEDVPGVEVLVHEHELALGRRELPKCVERGVEERALKRTARLFPSLREVSDPPRGLVRQGPEGRSRRLPEPRRERDEGVEGRVELEVGERRPGLRTLEEKGVPLRVVIEEPDRAVSVPEPKRLRLVLALAAGKLDLQDDVAGRNRE
jgi:hypothetical protein